MTIDFDGSGLAAAKVMKNFRNMKVTDIDPLGKGSTTFPREIEIQSIDSDGSKLIAVWDGWPSLAVGDYCVAQRDGIDSVLYVTGVSGATANNVTNEMANFFNGTFTESFDATVASDGATVTMSLEQSGTGDLTMRFSDGYTTLDCTPAATIALTAGTDPSPQGNWIYILQSTKVITKSTSAWPATEHIKIGFFFVQSAATVQTNGGPLINQNWNEHLQDTANLGHLAHIGRKIRALKATYFSGVDGNGGDGYLTITASNVEYKSTSGIIEQMHPQTYPAFDTSVSSVVHVKNWSGDAYHSITNLFDIVADSTGTTIGNNKWFNLVCWGVINKTGEHQTVLINLPAGFYNTQSDAESDVSGYDDFTIPREFNIDSSVGFLIVRITVKKATTWVHGSDVDLRGTTPQTASGGASGVATSFADNAFEVFNVTDNTKVIALSAASITTATTRTLTVPDASFIVAGQNIDNAFSASQSISTAGSTTELEISNTATDGDPILTFALSGTSTFTMGVDDGDSDKFKIGTTAIGTSTFIDIDPATGITSFNDNSITSLSNVTINNNAAYRAENAGGSALEVFKMDVNSDLLFWNPGTSANDIFFGTQAVGGSNVRMKINGAGNVSIGAPAPNPSGKLHIEQTSSTGALPVLLLNQLDISQEIMQIYCTVGTGNGLEAIAAKALTTTHFIKIIITGGLTRYIPCGTIA